MEEQIKKAIEARKNAHAPYSNYLVGAALKAKSGKIYTGCNIENHGISSICAERVAFTKAISEGEKEFESIAIVCGKAECNEFDEGLPCGYCRQFMSEFVMPDFKIICYKDDESIQEFTMQDLLPHEFKF